MDAWEKFKKNIYKNNLLKSKDKILLAVSAGPDSMCMLHLFWRLRKIMPVSLGIAYIDHGLRKQTSYEKEKISYWGKKLDIPVIIKNVRVLEYSKMKKISIETSGRELRYNALVKIAREYKYDKISTGHNANDNAETVLMWLIRGTGTEGIAGIPMVRTAENKINIIRPLLAITRKEIIDYLEKQKVSFCIDKSNYCQDFTRNRIRHQVVALLEKFNPCFIEHTYNLSRIISSENSFLRQITDKFKKKSVSVSKNQIMLDLNRFFGYNKIIQFRILKDILPQKCSNSQIERLFEWILISKKNQLSLSKSWHIIRKRDKLIFKPINY